MTGNHIDTSFSRNAFMNSKYFSTKHAHYFKIYDQLSTKIKSRGSTSPTIVEIGILHGGSLFMWREIFGPSARVIGVDLNPEATKWRDHGFDIFIGNQSDSNFWDKFYREVGLIDLLIDDGGHTNRQQVITTTCALKNMKPGGIIFIEDTNTSFLKEFGNPSKFSFINFSKKLVDTLHEIDEPSGQHARIGSKIEKISFFDSVVLLEMKEATLVGSAQIDNGGIRDAASDFRYADLGNLISLIKLAKQWSIRLAESTSNKGFRNFVTKAMLQSISLTCSLAFNFLTVARMKNENRLLRRYWRI